RGVARSNGATWDTIASLRATPATALVQDRHGDLWIGTRGAGVLRFDADRITLRQGYAASQLGSNFVNAMHEDRRGALWFATDAGAARLDSTGWTTFGATEGLVYPVQAIEEDRAGNLWFGTDGGGVARFHPDSLPAWSVVSPTQYLHVLALHADRSGRVWIGTRYEGLHRCAGGLADTAIAGAGAAFPLQSVAAIAEDSLGNLWLGSALGLSRFDGLSWRNDTVNDGLVSRQVQALRFDDVGNLWIGTDGGTSVYDRVSWSTISADGLSDRGVTAVFQDSSGAMWFGTAGAGAVRYRDGN